MTSPSPRGVIAAIATAIDRNGDIDTARSLALARLDAGDGRPAGGPYCHSDPAWARMMPPLSVLNAGEQATLAAQYDAIRAAQAA
jgi:hypothetical protein